MLRQGEDARDSRRRDFLQNVRRKAEDKAWERRDIEGKFLKNSFLADVGRLAHDAPTLSETDLDDAIRFPEEHQMLPEEEDALNGYLEEEEEEVEAMLASYQEQKNSAPEAPCSPALSDEEYDQVFAELIAQEEAESQAQSPVEAMDIS
ncbi:hypothetical protein UVI_02028940 [Ustilaginoidea virens]|nr:hypothetical protein UVI_02028940 [Ustilaginoidea virens]